MRVPQNLKKVWTSQKGKTFDERGGERKPTIGTFQIIIIVFQFHMWGVSDSWDVNECGSKWEIKVRFDFHINEYLFFFHLKKSI